MNSRAFVAVAFVVSAGLAGGAAVAFANAGDEGTTQARSPIVPSATPTPTVTPSPTPEPTATPTPTPSATASATATPTATASPAASSPTVRTYAYPRPSKEYYGLVLTVTSNPGGGNTGTTFELTAKGTDEDGEIYFAGLTWGDGASVPSQPSPQHCKSFPPLTSPPGAYQPNPDTATNVYRHRYPSVGTYLINVAMSSVNKDCTPHGPKAETRHVEIEVIVVSATPSPSPSSGTG